MIAFSKLKITFLDDDPLFTKNFRQIFEEYEKNCFKRFFSDANQFYQFFQENCLTYDPPEEILDSYFSNKINTENTLYCLEDLYSLPGIFVLDHNLDAEENGIDVARAIKEKNPAVFIILLTSFVDEASAISLLNENIINCFLKKDSLNVARELYEIVKRYEHTFYQQQEYDELKLNFNLQAIPKFDDYCIKLKQLICSEKLAASVITNKKGDIGTLTRHKKLTFYAFDKEFTKI